VPPPRLHTIKYAGVLAAASAWRRHLAAVGAATEVPQRSPGRGPPYWKSRGSFDAGGLSVGAGLRVYF